MQQSAVQEQFLDSVRIFWLNYYEIIENLKIKVQKLADYHEILEVWLFGSFAHIRAVPGSDLDLLFVIDKSDIRMIDRIERYQDLFADIGIGVDIFPYTQSESGSTFVQNAKKSGICVYQKSNIRSIDTELDSLILAVKKKRMGSR